MPKFSQILFGRKAKVKKAKTLTPEQEALSKLINEGLTKGTGAFGSLFGGFNEEAFKRGVADPAMKNFTDNILPQIQERFIAGNQALGSGMRRGQLRGAENVQSEISKLMYQAQQDAENRKLQGLQTALGTKHFENMYKPEQGGAAQGFVQGVAGGAGNNFGEKIGNSFGKASNNGPPGAPPVAG